MKIISRQYTTKEPDVLLLTLEDETIVRVPFTEENCDKFLPGGDYNGLGSKGE